MAILTQKVQNRDMWQRTFRKTHLAHVHCVDMGKKLQQNNICGAWTFSLHSVTSNTMRSKLQTTSVKHHCFWLSWKELPWSMQHAKQSGACTSYSWWGGGKNLLLCPGGYVTCIIWPTLSSSSVHTESETRGVCKQSVLGGGAFEKYDCKQPIFEASEVTLKWFTKFWCNRPCGSDVSLFLVQIERDINLLITIDQDKAIAKLARLQWNSNLPF